MRADTTLKVATANEEIVVTAERAHGEAEAINRERESDNILQVLPVDVITSLPNTNIADAVGRLPGAFEHPRLGFVDALVMFRELSDRA